MGGVNLTTMALGSHYFGNFRLRGLQYVPRTNSSNFLRPQRTQADNDICPMNNVLTCNKKIKKKPSAGGQSA